MNTIRSTWYGWATLCVAGGGAYYFAKKQINAERADRYNKERQKQERLHRLEAANLGYSEAAVKPTKKSRTDQGGYMNNLKDSDDTGSPSDGTNKDSASISHAPEAAEQRVRERGKYEAAEPYRSRKGDRFS